VGNGNNKVNPSLYVYLVGIIVLGSTYEIVKSALGDEYQGLKKVFFLTNFGTRTCEFCETEYETIKSKIIPATFAIIFPLFLGKHLPLFSSFPLLSFAWAVIGFGILLKYMPLKVVNN
jgi:hypothetical protein